jgi:hypothetical protein
MQGELGLLPSGAVWCFFHPTLCSAPTVPGLYHKAQTNREARTLMQDDDVRCAKQVLG